MMTFKRWMIGTSMLVFGMACTPEAGDGREDVRPVTVRLMLSVEGGSRADALHAANGQGHDFYIYPDDVELLAYDAAGNYRDRAALPVVTEGEIDRADGSRKYMLEGRFAALSKADNGKLFRFVLLANRQGVCRTAPLSEADLVTLTEDELYKNLTFSVVGDATSARKWNRLTAGILQAQEEGRIPMWGKQTAMLRLDAQGHTADRLEVSVLRALAKVEVRTDGEAQSRGYQISRVLLMQGRDAGCLTPAQASQCEATTFYTTQPEGDGEKGRWLNVTGECMANGVDFVEQAESYYLYIPEQPAITAGAFGQDAAYMQVWLKKGGEDKERGPYYLYFSTTSLGTKQEIAQGAFPVVRNYWYTFTITGVEEASFALRYQVNRWAEREETIVFN